MMSLTTRSALNAYGWCLIHVSMAGRESGIFRRFNRVFYHGCLHRRSVVCVSSLSSADAMTVLQPFVTDKPESTSRKVSWWAT